MPNDTPHPESLAGQTLRWKFSGGPTAGTVYEHVAPSTHLVSYLASNEKEWYPLEGELVAPSADRSPA